MLADCHVGLPLRLNVRCAQELLLILTKCKKRIVLVLLFTTNQNLLIYKRFNEPRQNYERDKSRSRSSAAGHCQAVHRGKTWLDHWMTWNNRHRRQRTEILQNSCSCQRPYPTVDEYASSFSSILRQPRTPCLLMLPVSIRDARNG